MAEHLDNMEAKLALHRFADLTDFLAKGCVLKFRYHGAASKPAQVTAVKSGTGIFRVFLCYFSKVPSGGKQGLYNAQGFFIINKDVPCPYLFLGGFKIGSDCIAYFRTQQVNLKYFA